MTNSKKVITRHQYVNDLPYKSTDKYLILGTIHPHRVENFKLDFFYGNKNTIWSIIDTATGISLKKKDEIIDLLDRNNIWISDIILECSRENEKVTDDKSLMDLKLNDKMIREGLINSQIDKVFFTSGFGKNNTARLFVEAFEIDCDRSVREFVIPKKVFGREMIGVVLFSPSPQASIGISKNKDYLMKKNQPGQESLKPSDFRIDFYREKFQFLS